MTGGWKREVWGWVFFGLGFEVVGWGRRATTRGREGRKSYDLQQVLRLK